MGRFKGLKDFVASYRFEIQCATWEEDFQADKNLASFVLRRPKCVLWIMPKILQYSLPTIGLLLCMLLCLASCKPDTESPVIRLKGSDTIMGLVGMPIEEPGYIAFDKEDLDLVDEVVISGNVNMSRAGTYQRIYTVTDAAGNSAQANRTVILDISMQSLVGTFRSDNAFGPCSGFGSSQITILDEANKILKISPAVGYFAQTNNYIRMHYNGSTAPQLTSVAINLPCSYYAYAGTGTGRIFNNGDSIHVFIRVTSSLYGTSTYFTADYVRLE